MRIYRHTQTGTLILWLLGTTVVVAGWVAFRQFEGRGVTLGVLALVMLSLFLFSSLTVRVTDREISLVFGPGLIRKTFRVEDIADARVVTNPWYYGWGIHLTPRGRLFNVSGFEAVELDLNGARGVRIGTDEPGRLLAAIRQAMASRRP